MAKPHDAIELEVPADLVEASFHDAFDILIKESIDRDWHSTHGLVYDVLRIPSQLMGVALVLRVHNIFMIEPSFTYDKDEWSYHRRAFNKNTKEFDELIVWTPGA